MNAFEREKMETSKIIVFNFLGYCLNVLSCFLEFFSVDIFVLGSV